MPPTTRQSLWPSPGCAPLQPPGTMLDLELSFASAEQSPRRPQSSFPLGLPPTLSQKPPSVAAMTTFPLSGLHRAHLQQPLWLFHPQHPLPQKSGVSPRTPDFSLLPHIPTRATSPPAAHRSRDGLHAPRKGLQDTPTVGSPRRPLCLGAGRGRGWREGGRKDPCLFTQ